MPWIYEGVTESRYLVKSMRDVLRRPLACSSQLISIISATAPWRTVSSFVGSTGRTASAFDDKYNSHDGSMHVSIMPGYFVYVYCQSYRGLRMIVKSAHVKR